MCAKISFKRQRGRIARAVEKASGKEGVEGAEAEAEVGETKFGIPQNE